MPSQGKRSWDATDDNEARDGEFQRLSRSHAVTNLGDRLEKLENALSGLQSSLPSRDPEDAPFQATTPPNSSSSRPYGRRCSIRNVGGHERYYGSTSLVSLIQDMAAVIQANLCNVEDSPGTDTTLANAAREELLQLTEFHDTYRRVSDGSVLTSPPQVIIEAMVDPYFEMVNPHMPIWTKDGFRKLMASSGQLFDASKRRAYDVCASNLVLLTLQAKSLQARARSNTPFIESPATPSIDGDLVKSFIVNAKRALENVELLLLSPSLLSLQALLSLCLVAQISLSEDVTALLFSLAVHVAKSIGLYQWNMDQEASSSSSEIDDKRHVMYCMLCLNRAVPWSSGLSSTFPGANLYERNLLNQATDDMTNRLSTRVSLLKLEEQIYSSLYSDQATRQNASDIAKSAVGLGQKLEDWATQHQGQLREDLDFTAATDVSNYELGIRLWSLKALAEWPLIGSADLSHSLLDTSRRTLRLYQGLWRTRPEKGHHLTIALLVASYPPVPLFELSRHLVCSQESTEEDVDLLQSFVGMIRTFSEWADPNSYIKKLSKFSLIMLQLATYRRESSSSLSSGADGTSPRPAATVQVYMHTLGVYPAPTTTAPHIYGGDSAASSSSHSNSTPLSGGVQPMPPVSETESITMPEISASAISTSLGSFDGFDNNLSPMDELNEWMVDPRMSSTMRTSLQPNQMTGFMLQDNGTFSFGELDLG